MPDATETRGGPGNAPRSTPGSTQGAGAQPAGGAGSAGRNLLFLREEELRLAQDLLFFGYRDFTAGPDAILAEMGMGRAHHRVLHFLGRRPGLTVGELLGILAITKQSLSRVLTPLMQGGYVAQSPGRADRRQRLLALTPEGTALERRLFERQRETVTRAYREAGPVAVEGFRHVMRGLMGAEARRALERLGGTDRPSVRAVPPAAGARPAAGRAAPPRPAQPAAPVRTALAEPAGPPPEIPNPERTP